MSMSRRRRWWTGGCSSSRVRHCAIRLWDESACVAEKWLQGRDPSPSAGPRREEETAILLAAIDDLPEPHREIVLLLKLEGLTTREAAERLDMSRTAVALRAGEAIRRLREVMGPTFGEDNDDER